MAHHHQYQPPRPFAGELDGSGRSQLEGEIFEMPADSVATTTKGEQAVQANPWPFYLDQDVRTETRAEEEDGVKARDGGAKGKATEQPLANPWAYFGPEEDEDKDGHETKAAAVVESNAGGLGIKVEESADSKAKSEDASPLLPPPLHHSNQDERGGHDDAPPLPPPPTTSDYPQPLRLSRKQVPTAAAAPVFKPYLPPVESSTAAVAPLRVKHQRASSEGGDLAALPYRPYRPAGHVTPPVSKVDDRVDVAAPSAVLPLRPASSSSPPPKSHESLVTGAVAPHRTPSPQTTSSASPNLVPQQHRIAESSGSADGPLNGAAPHRSTSPAVAGSRPPSVPASAPPVPGPVPTVAIAVVEPLAAAAPTSCHTTSQDAVPQTTSVPSYHSLPSPSASSPALGGPSNSSPALGHLPASSPTPSHQAYAPPHSAPSSSIPSPEMASYPFQPINQAQPQNLYPVPTPTPPTASPGHPASMFYPPPQQYTPPPPPTSSYDIPQRTYATPAEIPPPQPPRPQFQQAYSPQPQLSPQPPSPYMFADVSRPVTQSPSYGQSSAYNLPYGPAVALHQHQYPTQPTYAAAPTSDAPSSPDVQDAYASPPLPPRPETAQGSQPQVFTGFTPHVVAYPPPPRRVFDPPPAVATSPHRKSSGGTSSGRLFSSSSALKWIDKRGKGLENRLDAVLGSQGPSNRPPPQPPRPS